MDEDGSTDITNVDKESFSAGTKIGGLSNQVIPLFLSFEIYTFDNENNSQIKAQPHWASQHQQPHKSCGRSEVPQLRV